MFTMDVPNVPAQDTPIVLAQAAVPGAPPQPDYLLKLCTETTSIGDPMSAWRGVDPAGWLAQYLANRDHRIIDMATRASIKPILLEGTTHGELVPYTAPNGALYYMYDPIREYTGNDQAVFMAEFEGKTYKIVVELHVYPEAALADNVPNSCPPPQLIKVNGKPVSGSLSFDSSYSLNSTLNTGILDSITVDPSLVTLNIADLPGGAVGQTVGTNITLDDNAAGYGWFIDTTPADNSEYLPTSNPNEWVAKGGSDAAGKMDMLSVLLHEYGHALGIEHSADSGDYMGTTLTVGVRRLPSATELALMQQLIGQAKGEMIANASTPSPALPLQGGGGQDVPFPTLPISLGGLAFAGLLRPNRYGSLSPSTELRTGIDLAAPATQYEAAANATFTNLDTANAWQTQGSVDIAPSTGAGGTATATLNEVSTSQTRLSQVFMLNDNDRYLSFTLAGAPLPNPLPEGEGANGAASGSGYGPSDAFEVALLDASTGASVLTGDGLTRTDVFLNPQADGTQNTADCVTCIVNADGRRISDTLQA